MMEKKLDMKKKRNKSNLITFLKRYLQKFIIVSLAVLAILVCSIMAVNIYVERAGTKYILDQSTVPTADAILVLGAYVYPDGTTSSMLTDRLTVGYELYNDGKAPKIVVSGDHGRKNYDEVNAMKSFLKEKGVPSQDIFMDHAGFSTYESVYRARDIFQIHKVIIVTQDYHLMRAVFSARALGLEAYGIPSDLHDYGQAMKMYRLREIAARNKDFVWAKLLKPKPTFLGEVIPVFGDGRATDDK